MSQNLSNHLQDQSAERNESNGRNDGGRQRQVDQMQMSNQLAGQEHIDFYGNGDDQGSADELELFDGEQYESSLNHGANEQL